MSETKVKTKKVVKKVKNSKYYWTAKEDATLLAAVTKNESSIGRVEAIKNAAKQLERSASNAISRYYRLTKNTRVKNYAQTNSKKHNIIIQRYPDLEISKVVEKRNGDKVTYYRKK